MYKYTVSLSCANRAAALSEIWTQLIAMGWSLHDNQDGSSYRVYSSNGESGTEPLGYIKISWVTANQILCIGYYYWNSSTHVGYGTNTSGASTATLTTSESGCYLWVYGDKNYVFLVSKVSTTYYNCNFGHLPNRFWTKQTTLTAPASPGSSVTLTIVSTSGFVANQYYQIYGVNAEGRDKVQVTSITNETNLVVATLPRSYASGSILGQTPSTFGFGNNLINYEVSPIAAVGNGDITGVASVTTYAGTTTADVRGKLQWVLQPAINHTSTAASFTLVGYIDVNFLKIATGIVEDTIDIGRQDSGTAESGGVTTLTDTDKSWTPNAWANKVVIIIFGTGIGQIRKISSNTATELTVSTNWTLQPDATSQYIIADEGYRVMSASSVVCREGI